MNAGRLTVVGVVAGRELYEQARSPLIWALAVAAALLSVFSTHVAITRVRIAESRQQFLVETRDRERLKTDGRVLGAERDPGLRVLRPPETLSILASGLDDVLPELWDFGPSGVHTGRSSANLGGALVSEASILDLEMIIRLMIGLLAICLAIETIAAERASGALLALLGQPISRRLILSGKLLGGTVTLAAIVGIVAAAALTTTAMAHPAFVSWDYVVSLLLLCGAGTVYALICFAGGMLLAIRFAAYRLALVAAFVAWTLATLVAVPAASVIAQAAARTRPAGVLEAERDRLVQTATTAVQRRMGDEYAAALGGPATWTQLREDAALVKVAQARAERLWDESAKELRARLDALSTQAMAEEARNRRIALWLSVPNPAAAFMLAASNLSATGDRIAVRWQTATAAHQQTLEQRVFDNPPSIFALVPYSSARKPGTERRLIVMLERRAPPKVEELATFARPSRTTSQRLRDAWPYLAALAFYAGLFVIASIVAFDRLRL
jgi:ABC-type transport system involved in multi-copper enzyme maturation permease subunit